MATDPARDPLGSLLGTLADSVQPLEFQLAAQVRARGNRRTRRTRAAATAAAVTAVATVAAVGFHLRPTHAVVLPASPTRTSSSTPPTPTASTVAVGPTPTPNGAPPPTATPAGTGVVPANMFLSGRQWQGPGLNGGRDIVTGPPKELEGSVQRFVCDSDTAFKGNVAVLQAQERRSHRFVGAQKVRLLTSIATASTAFTDQARAMPTCQQRLRAQALRDAAAGPPGAPAPVPNASVVEDAAGRVDDGTGAVRIYSTRTDYGTGAGSQLIELVVLVREGPAVTSISLPMLDGATATTGELRRLAESAREMLRQH